MDPKNGDDGRLERAILGIRWGESDQIRRGRSPKPDLGSGKGTAHEAMTNLNDKLGDAGS